MNRKLQFWFGGKMINLDNFIQMKNQLEVVKIIHWEDNLYEQQIVESSHSKAIGLSYQPNQCSHYSFHYGN